MLPPELPWYLILPLTAILLIADKYYFRPKFKAKYLQRDKEPVHGPPSEPTKISRPKTSFLLLGLCLAFINISIMYFAITGLDWGGWEGYRATLQALVVILVAGSSIVAPPCIIYAYYCNPAIPSDKRNALTALVFGAGVMVNAVTCVLVCI